ncbi:addiction module antidote protein [Pseudomonas sp. MDT1-17]
MTANKLTKWDVVDHFITEEDMALYLEACLEENDPALLSASLGDIARARGMAQLARDTVLTREGRYKTLSGAGNPSLATIMKVMGALGVKYHAEFKPAHL